MKVLKPILASSSIFKRTSLTFKKIKKIKNININIDIFLGSPDPGLSSILHILKSCDSNFNTLFLSNLRTSGLGWAHKLSPVACTH